MAKMKFYPSGKEAAKEKQKPFMKEVGDAFNDILNDADNIVKEETGWSKGKRFLAAAGATVSGAALYKAGWGLAAAGFNDIGAVSFIGAGIFTAGAMGVVHHVKNSRMVKGFVAGAKAFDETSGLSKTVKDFVGAAKKRIVAAEKVSNFIMRVKGNGKV